MNSQKSVTTINLSEAILTKLHEYKYSPQAVRIASFSELIETLLAETIHVIEHECPPPLPVHSLQYQLWAEFETQRIARQLDIKNKCKGYSHGKI